MRTRPAAAASPATRASDAGASSAAAALIGRGERRSVHKDADAFPAVGRPSRRKARRKREGAPKWLANLERRYADLPWLPEFLRPDVPQIVAAKNPGAPAKLPEGQTRRALIVGGGLGGLSAALELAERGYEVTLREAAEDLGGRLDTHKTRTQAGEFKVEHGLHMWFDNYHVFQDIRDRLGINDQFRPYEEVHFEFKKYEPEVLASRPAIYPLNMVGLLRRSKNMSILEAIGDFGAIQDIINYDHATVYEKYDRMTIREWAEKKGLSDKFLELYVLPAASVTLNDPEKMSAAEMLHMMHEYFIGQPHAMDREMTVNDHGTSVIDPWARRLRSLGVKIETETPVGGLRFEDGKAVGEIGKDEQFDWVVMATNVGATKKILAASQGRDDSGRAGLEAVRATTAPLEVAPHYKVLRLWLDTPPNPERPDVIETPEHPPINLIGQFHLLENESAAWANKTGGAVMEFHLYDTPELRELSEDEVWARIRPTVLELMPELADAKVLGSTMNSRDDFTSYETGQGLARPDADAPQGLGVDNLTFAGDWVNTDYPCALMERAVATGREAANAILLGDGVRQVDIPVTRSRGPGLI